MVNVVTNLKVKSALFRGIDNLVEFTKYIRTAEGTLDGYAADAQGEGDGGDRAKAMEGMGCDARGKGDKRKRLS
ncbi:hypothetical protein GOBAR_AA13829 [Gossypium barbadense]|uniref:Uncharacterized protein n=1 Tax=Gossypium barbadense TaxID=3634 RepID=A0A2P5XU00_GOSBA|nr:hypothetical protein GOBAR_AA13829 [Gossypium barbadense]